MALDLDAGRTRNLTRQGTKYINFRSQTIVRYIQFVAVSMASMPFYLPMILEGDPMKMQSGLGYIKHDPV